MNLVRFVPVCAVSVAGMDPDFVKEIGEFERSNHDRFIVSGLAGRRPAPQAKDRGGHPVTNFFQAPKQPGTELYASWGV